MYDIKELLNNIRVPAEAEAFDFRFIIPLWRMDDERCECMYLYDEDLLWADRESAGVKNCKMFCGEVDVYSMLTLENGTFRREGVNELMKDFINAGTSYKFPNDITPEMKAAVFGMTKFRAGNRVQEFIDRYFTADRISPASEHLCLGVGMPG